MAANTKSLIEDDAQFVWHPYTQKGLSRSPILISHGKGTYLFTPDGRAILDGISSWWVNLHGHSHPYIVERIKEQAETLEHVIFADFTHQPAAELARRLLSILPGNLSKVFYTDNGSTAVEAALKMAIQYWYNQDPKTKKKTVVCFNKSYHGDTFGAMSAAGKNGFNQPFWSYLFDVVTIDLPQNHTIDKFKKILETGEVACFIFEPLILGAGGMIIYPAEDLDALLRLCRQYDVITIADEVMTGFGRTGSLFACSQLVEEPDIICLSKGLTGGFLPLGATACKQKIYDAFVSKELQKAFLHGHTYSGNPICCKAALASLDLLLMDNCRSQRALIADCHMDFCRKWRGHAALNRCESIGTILALEYKTEGETSYFQGLRNKLYHHFLDRDILLRPLGNVLYVLPPYCIQADELQHIYDTITLTFEL